ncbi:MAG: hypothetical protein H0X37_18270 [Herpetosiphonaceae bacterium]|nr:hypothetical protein [Herpetosiphonaceae bacterium]
MAEIVKDLVAGGAERLEDTTWFHTRVAEADLSLEEFAALEALRVRLSERDATLLDDIGSVAWS